MQKLRFPIFLAALAFSAVSAVAQTAGAGTITGTLTDQSGAAVPGAAVVVRNTDTGIDRSTVSQIMQTMIRKGLLKRRRTKEDARAYAITLTDHGRDVLKASEAIATGVDEALIAALPATRAKTFIDNLRTIIAQREDADA